MSKINNNRKGCKDVFHSFLVENANYDNKFELPCLKKELVKPNKLISFSKAISHSDYDGWVHFYEDDVMFERIWNNPKRYLKILKRFRGVITPDFSLYRDMPIIMQQWNVYRSRALGHWWQQNDIHVLPNIRYGDSRTFELACAGIEKHGIICVGSYGCIKNKEDRYFFKEGLQSVVNLLDPISIIVFGSTPNDIFAQYKDRGIEILRFNKCFIKSGEKER